MTPQHLLRRAWFVAPCLLHALAIAHAQPAPPGLAARAPAGFKVEVKRFELEPVNPFSAQNGADTCVTVETIERQAPPNVRWFFNRRLVALKDGKERVLWDDKSAERLGKDVGVGVQKSLSTGYRNDNFLFALRDVPVQDGEIMFLWDALAQPSKEEVPWGDDKIVSLAEMDKLAQNGGVRLSRKLVVRRAGERIHKPVFAPAPALRVIEAIVQPLDEPDEAGNDTKIALRLAYSGTETAPVFTTDRGLALSDASIDEEQQDGIMGSYQEEAIHEEGGPNYRFEGSAKSADIRKVKRLRLTIDISDSKSWPLQVEAFADVPAPKK